MNSVLDFCSLDHWFEPTQGHISSLISFRCPLLFLDQLSINNGQKGGLKQHSFHAVNSYADSILDSMRVDPKLAAHTLLYNLGIIFISVTSFTFHAQYYLGNNEAVPELWTFSIISHIHVRARAPHNYKEYCHFRSDYSWYHHKRICNENYDIRYNLLLSVINARNVIILLACQT